MRLLLGLDAGNHSAKVVGPYGTDTFKTNICDWFERDVVEVFGDDDMEFEINGRKGYAGTIAQYEDEFGNGAMYGDSKAHEDTKIRVLLAIHRYLEKYRLQIYKISIVTGQPISKHNQAEKDLIRNMLEGEHLVTVNGKRRLFEISDVGVSGEGSGAYWCEPKKGVVRILDIGSGTVNAATIVDNKFINNQSATFNFGVETIKNKYDYATIARGIIRNLTRLKWGKHDTVQICGGISEGIAPFIAEHYPNAEVIRPIIRNGNEVKLLHPVYANSVGFYELAKGAFG